MPVPDAETEIPRYTHQCIACSERIDARRVNRKEKQCHMCQRATSDYEGGEVFRVYRAGDYWVIRDSVTGLVTQGPTKPHALEMFADAMNYRNRAGGVDINWVAEMDREIGAVPKP